MPPKYGQIHINFQKPFHRNKFTETAGFETSIKKSPIL